MARILYIFPHPDDESFGPAPALACQRREGHDVHLLTLTRGEATRQREKYGYTKDEMAQVRYDEMQDVARALDLSSLTVLDLPDGGLHELSPLRLESVVEAHIEQLRPSVVVTYPVHGISGHPDHLVTHAVVKRVYCALRQQEVSYLHRLAFFTVSETAERPEHLRTSPASAIDVVMPFEETDLKRAERALACYETYQDVVEAHDPLRTVADGCAFELFGETHDPPLDDLLEGLEDVAA